jgi:hypothetical protein
MKIYFSTRLARRAYKEAKKGLLFQFVKFLGGYFSILFHCRPRMTRADLLFLRGRPSGGEGALSRADYRRSRRARLLSFDETPIFLWTNQQAACGPWTRFSLAIVA